MSRRGVTLPGATVQLLVATRPLLVACKLFGLTPFTVDAGTACLKRSAADVALFILASGLHVISASSLLLLLSKFLPENFLFSFVQVTVIVQLIFLSTFATIADFSCNTGKYKKIIETVTKFDNLMGSHHSTVDAKVSKFVRNQLVSIFCFYFAISFYSGNLYSYGIQWLILLLTLYCGTPCTMNVVKFIDLQLVTKERVKVFNKCLEHIRCGVVNGRYECRIATETYVVPLTSDTIPMDLRVTPPCLRCLRRAYIALCELSRTVTDVHEIFVLLYLVAVSTHAVEVIYLVATLPSKDSMFTLSYYLMVSNVVQLAVVLLPAHMLATEAGRTARMTSQLQLRSCSWPATARRELQLLHLQVRCVTPAPALLGIVQLRLGLVATYVSVVTTYTTVLITFSNPHKTSNSYQ